MRKTIHAFLAALLLLATPAAAQITFSGVSSSIAGSGTVQTLTAGTNVDFSSGATCTVNCTINVPTIPVSGITGLGTGVATALGTAVSGSGAICLQTGSACPGLALTVTDGTTSVTDTTSLAFGTGFQVTSGGAGLPNVNLRAPNRTITMSDSVVATDMAGQINLDGTSITLTIPTISGTIFPANTTLRLVNDNATAATISSTPTITGCPTPTTIQQYGVMDLTSNGTSLDCAGNAPSGGTDIIAGTNITIDEGSPCTGSCTINSTGGGSGSVVTIATRTAANSDDFKFGQGQAEGSLDATYNRYILDCTALKPGTAGSWIFVQVGEDNSGTVAYKVSNYFYGVSYYTLDNGTVVAPTLTIGDSTASTNFGMMTALILDTARTTEFVAKLSLQTGEVRRKMNFIGDFTASGLEFHIEGGGSYSGDQTAITGLRVVAYDSQHGTLLTGAAAFVSGQCTLQAVVP